MTAKLPLGWDIYMAKNNYVRGGRLYVGAGTTWMTRDLYPSYPGYGGFNSLPVEMEGEHDLLQNEIIWWLTGKSTGANILLCQDGVSVGTIMDIEFQEGLTRNGHTFQLTGGTSTLGGYDPLDYDCWLIGGGSLAFSDAIIDSYLSSNGSLWWTMNSFTPTYLSRYGVSSSGFQTPVTGAFPYWGYYTTVTAFRPVITQHVRHVVYSDVKLSMTSNTMGGTETYYTSEHSEILHFTWSSV